MKKQINLSNVEMPSFLLNFPGSYNTAVKNNVWMSESDEPVDSEAAVAQWYDLYSFLAAQGLVTVMPTPPESELQDLVFVANMGMVIDDDNIIISNFKSEPRVGEQEVGIQYFKTMFKNVHVCPYHWEGEADTKHIRDNIYIGGYGQRTDIRAYQWMEENFDIKIIKVKMNNPKLYHFDCMLFPITKTAVLACKKTMTNVEIAEIESHGIEIIDVPLNYTEAGIMNAVRVHNFVLISSDFYDLDPVLDKDDYRLERAKNQFLEDICVSLGMEAVYLNLSEYTKGGAMLSCNVMHLNRFSYETELI